MRTVCVAAFFLGSACAWTNTNTPTKLSDSRRTMAPDGNPAWAIACTRSVSECYDECARVCPSGYTILDKNNEGYSSRANGVNGQGWAASQGSSTIERVSMLIECRNASSPTSSRPEQPRSAPSSAGPASPEEAPAPFPEQPGQ